MLKLVPASHPAHTPSRELHVSRESRDRYQFDQSLFSLRGQVIFADFHSARLVTQRMNERRDLGRFPEQAVRASELYALGLIDEILHHIVAEYKRQRRPDVMQRALERHLSGDGGANHDHDAVGLPGELRAL